MAARAPIKKRALAEFQSHTLTIVAEAESSRSVKRLRLIKKAVDGRSLEGSSAITAAEKEIDALDSVRPPSENFRAVSKIVASLPLTVGSIVISNSFYQYDKHLNSVNNKCF